MFASSAVLHRLFHSTMNQNSAIYIFAGICNKAIALIISRHVEVYAVPRSSGTPATAPASRRRRPECCKSLALACVSRPPADRRSHLFFSALRGPVVSSTGAHGLVHVGYRQPFGGKTNVKQHKLQNALLPDTCWSKCFCLCLEGLCIGNPELAAPSPMTRY